MSQIRYFIHQRDGAWNVRRDSQGLGFFGEVADAVTAAHRQAAVDRVRGHSVEILQEDGDGRWQPCDAVAV